MSGIVRGMGPTKPAAKKPAATKPAAGSILVSADPPVIVTPDEHDQIQATLEAQHKPRR